MTYQLTPTQRQAIRAVNTCCREHGLPEYLDVVLALAGITVAVRDGLSTKVSLKGASKVLDGLRNDSAPKEKKT